MNLAATFKAAVAYTLMGGMLLTCACMLFVCPLIGAAPVAEESCHPVSGHGPEPVQCPYAIMQPVYAPPLVDLTFGQDPDRADLAMVAAPEVREPAGGQFAEEAELSGAPPGPSLHVRLCVFRI
jgi:hypothetical protein